MPPHASIRERRGARLTQRGRLLGQTAVALAAFVVLGALATARGETDLTAGIDGPAIALAAPAAPAAEGAPPEQAPRPPTEPTAAQVAAARAYAKRRRGVVSFAVTDSAGRLRGLRRTRRFWSASLIKPMLLVAYLRRLDRAGQPLRAADRALLGPMIRRSDNATATRAYLTVGNAGLNAVARRAGMRRFRPSPHWGGSLITAEDQARFFRRIDALTPARSRPYARSLLENIVSWQRWGIPRASARGTRLLFKGGWRRGHGGRIVNQVAKLEAGDRVVSVAILTDGNPSHHYGTETVRGVAARLLR